MFNKKLLAAKKGSKWPPHEGHGIWMIPGKADNYESYGYKGRYWYGEVSRIPKYRGPGTVYAVIHILYDAPKNTSNIDTSRGGILENMYLSVNHGPKYLFKEHSTLGAYTDGDPLNLKGNLGQMIYLTFDPPPDKYDEDVN